MWLDNMNCSGSQARLADCDGSAWPTRSRPRQGSRGSLATACARPLGRGVLTPYAGFSMTGDGAGHTCRIGTRWSAEPAFALALEASHGEAGGEIEPTTVATLRAALRW